MPPPPVSAPRSALSLGRSHRSDHPGLKPGPPWQPLPAACEGRRRCPPAAVRRHATTPSFRATVASGGVPAARRARVGNAGVVKPQTTSMPIVDVRNVLVPLDGSELALQALPTARVLAERFDADLHTITVAGSSSDADRARRLGAAVLDVPIGDQRVSVVSSGEPAETIARRAASLGSCVVCLATHGRGRLGGALIGPSRGRWSSARSIRSSPSAQWPTTQDGRPGHGAGRSRCQYSGSWRASTVPRHRSRLCRWRQRGHERWTCHLRSSLSSMMFRHP